MSNAKLVMDLVSGLKVLNKCIGDAASPKHDPKTGQFTSGSGSSGGSKPSTSAATAKATATATGKIESILKNGPRTKSDHSLLATHYAKKASAAKMKGEPAAKVKSLETKARHHKTQSTLWQH